MKPTKYMYVRRIPKNVVRNNDKLQKQMYCQNVGGLRNKLLDLTTDCFNFIL